MAAVQILATASGVADSADIAITAATAVALKGVSGEPTVNIFLKDDAAAYQYIGRLDVNNPAMCIIGPGDYRFSRGSKGTCGVFRG